MRSPIGTGVPRQVSLGAASRKRFAVQRHVPALVALFCGVILTGVSLAQQDNQQDNMPPETVAPALRHNGPHPAANAAAADTGAQQLANSRIAVSHRRGIPPNVVTAPPPQPQPVQVTATIEPASLLQLPPKRAQVRVTDTEIAVQADNSSLSQVLHDIGSATGMKVEGLNRDERIFGSYGPGTPRDVLTALLDGAGYNVLMVGEATDGAPRQLILSQRNGGTPSSLSAGQPKPTEEDDAEPDPGEQDTEAAPPPTPVPVAPAAVRPNGPGNDGGIRTPQQLLEQLQRLHQDQPQSQAPQQQQQPPPE